MKGKLFDIQRGSFVDGPGIRTTVFFKGCHLGCGWCHNPEGRSNHTERMWYTAKCIRCLKCAEVCPNQAVSYTASTGVVSADMKLCRLCGRCELICPNNAVALCGYDAETDDIFKIVAKDAEFYRASGGGVTLSGGECLLQPEFAAELLCKCSSAGIHTAVDTSGEVPWSNIQAVLEYTDLFLYDIKCVTPELHLRHIGVSNERIIDNYLRLLSIGADVIVRVPMICEFNANDSEFNKIADFLRAHRPRMVELLPYHALGENKYRALSLGSPTAYHAPDESNMRKYKQMIGDITS